MQITLCGGPAGGESVTLSSDALGTTYDHDLGTRLARYELREYEIDGVVEKQAVFIGFAPKV